MCKNNSTKDIYNLETRNNERHNPSSTVYKFSEEYINEYGNHAGSEETKIKLEKRQKQPIQEGKLENKLNNQNNRLTDKILTDLFKQKASHEKNESQSTSSEDFTSVSALKY